MDSELLSFQGVGFAYPNMGRFTERFPALRPKALEDVSFSVRQGESIALLGCNGSGKTTLLQMCNGLLAPQAGAILWRGSPLDRSRGGLARLRLEIGLLFQDPDDQLFAGSLREDVSFAPCNQGLGGMEVRRRVDEALDLVGLGAYAELPPHVLSHGMRKRAALAGVLAAKPGLLLLDEPTAGLDPTGEERVMEVLAELVGQGTSVLLSTHDLDLARRFADRALVLAEGRLVAFAGIDDVLGSPGTLTAAGLVRRASWNRPFRCGVSLPAGEADASPAETGGATNRGILIAATGSGCGKTSIACGIVRALARRGLEVRPAKCGPDYLDPLWLSRAARAQCPNLDPWMSGEEGVRRLASGDGLLVVEAAMGLYDGIRPDSDEGSGASVARILGVPVVLVVDASGAARTVAAVVRGLRDFGAVRVAGVVANRVGSARHASLIAEALASASLPPLLGHLLDGSLPALPGRHLGLVPPGEDEALFEALANAVAETVDLEAIVAAASPLPPGPPLPPRSVGVGRVRLGLSWDDAFRFAYTPVVDRLVSQGVEVVRFSPTVDSRLPDDLDGLWLCGGYPEAHARSLAANATMRNDVARFCASGRPVLAECGGLLYLARELVDLDGRAHPMCGVIPARGVLGGRLKALGYRTVRAREDLFLLASGQELRGHEFHYGALEGERSGRWRSAFDWEGARGSLGQEGWWNGSVLATWFHGWLDHQDVVARWIDAMRRARGKEEGWK